MLGDCLERMAEIPSGSVDLVLTDPPYGTTACAWDTVIPFREMWEQIWRVLKPNRAVVLFGQEPFSSLLRASEINRFKYDWYWRKSRPSGFTNAKLKPLKDIEVISVFSQGMTANGSKNNMPYYPQGLEDFNKEWSRPQRYMTGDKGVNPARVSHALSRKIEKTGYPRQVLDFPNPNNDVLHPTQKPLDLMDYLVCTHSSQGDTVLDFTMGSGTTGVACVNTGRKFIGIERDESYFSIAESRINAANKELMNSYAEDFADILG